MQLPRILPLLRTCEKAVHAVPSDFTISEKAVHAVTSDFTTSENL